MENSFEGTFTLIYAFLRMIIFKTLVFKLSDSDEGMHKHAIQMKKECLAFLKKVI